jgi:hypothetical protein
VRWGVALGVEVGLAARPAPTTLRLRPGVGLLEKGERRRQRLRPQQAQTQNDNYYAGKNATTAGNGTPSHEKPPEREAEAVHPGLHENGCQISHLRFEMATVRNKRATPANIRPSARLVNGFCKIGKS